MHDWEESENTNINELNVESKINQPKSEDKSSDEAPAWVTKQLAKEKDDEGKN